MEMEVVVAAQSSSVSGWKHQGKGAWGQGGAHFQDKVPKGQVELVPSVQGL